MATVGSLGGITFNVSSRRVMTFDNYKRSGSIKSAEHEIIAEKSNTEFTGLDAEEITFDVQLVSQLHVSPESQLKKLRAMRDSGQVVNFMLGNAPVGKNKWVIKDLSESTDYWSGHGKMQAVAVSITLHEYRIDLASSKASTPWGNIQNQIEKVRDTVETYKDDVLDVFDKVDDVTGGIL